MSVFTQKSEIFTIFGIISEPHWDKPLCLELTGIWILPVKLIKVYPTSRFYLIFCFIQGSRLDRFHFFGINYFMKCIITVIF